MANRDSSSNSANDFCKSCNRTVIGINHVYGALDELEFGAEFKEKLTKALEEYKQQQTNKKGRDAKKKGKSEEGEEGEAKTNPESEVAVML